MFSRIVCSVAATGCLLPALLSPTLVSATGTSASVPPTVVCALSIPSLNATELQRDQTIVTARLAALGAAQSAATYSGGNCLSVTVRGVRHPRDLLMAAIHVGYLANAESGRHFLARGTHVQLVCRKNGCASGLPVGKQGAGARNRRVYQHGTTAGTAGT